MHLCFAKNLGIFNYDYSIVECGSKSSIPQFIRLLNAFHIPYVAVYDKDNHYWRNETELENSTLKNKMIQKLVWKKLGEWVEFENDIEQAKLEDIKSYNCTEGGARINGAIEKPFLEVINELCKGKKVKNLPNIKKVFDIFVIAIDNSNSIFIYCESTILHVIKECKFK